VPGSQQMREQQHPYHIAYRWPVCTHDTSSGPAHTLLGSLPTPVNPSRNVLAPYMHTYKSTQTACLGVHYARPGSSQKHAGKASGKDLGKGRGLT